MNAGQILKRARIESLTRWNTAENGGANRQSHYLKERERQLRESGRSDDADLAGDLRERLELPKARLAFVVDQYRFFTGATLRSDFYPSYQEFPELIELTKPSGKFDLRAPTPLRDREHDPATGRSSRSTLRAGARDGQRLDEALRDAASVKPESLPLLEHVLSLLYDQQSTRGDDLLRWSDYRELGELKGALAKHAEAVFSTLGPDDQRAFPLVMRYLVTLGQGEEEVPNRRTAPYRDFVTQRGRIMM